MGVTPSQFYAPVGPIDVGLLFPGEQPDAITTRFNGYITAGQTAAAKVANATPAQRDEITELYVVWRAYDAVVERLAVTPSSYTAADEGSVSYSSAQLKTMERKRDEALDAYNALVAGIGAPTPVDDRTPSTTRRVISRP